jgi:hypothetical protein
MHIFHSVQFYLHFFRIYKQTKTKNRVLLGRCKKIITKIVTTIYWHVSVKNAIVLHRKTFSLNLENEEKKDFDRKFNAKILEKFSV